MNLLIPNLGSTSLKYQLIAMPQEQVLARGKAERVSDYKAAIAGMDFGGAPVDAVVFKAVHAGPGRVSASRPRAQRYLSHRHPRVPRSHARHAARRRV